MLCSHSGTEKEDKNVYGIQTQNIFYNRNIILNHS